MWFKIATAVSQPIYLLRQSMPYIEFMQWGAFFDLERENYTQTDVNIAQLAVNVHNNMYKSKMKLSDVLPSSIKKAPQTQNQISGKLKALAQIINR